MPEPKILLLDIETSPMLCYAWKCFDENIGIDQIIEPSRIICWGAAWFGQRGVIYEDERGGAEKMLKGIHALLSESDAVVTYNGDHFDLQKLDGAFLEYGIPPVPPVTSIDLYKTVRNLGYQSNKLAYIAPFLGIGEKIKHEGFPLWRSCMEGDEKAWKRMKRYNKMDVELLQGLYRTLRPYIRNHPYLGTGDYSEAAECPACQSKKSQSRGVRRTRSFIIHRHQCLDCGGWFTGKRRKVA